MFDVYVNGRKRCRAGVGSDGVLSAIVSWVKLTGPAARTARRLRHPLEEARLHVGGLRSGIHRTWLERDLAPGDRIGVVLGTAKTADRPRRVHKTRTPTSVAREETTFLNVDLDIWSRSPLDALVKAFGRQAFALHVGKDGRGYVAHLELAAESTDPDRLITRFVRLVERLPRSERRVWDRARVREFNVGIQAAAGPASYELRLAHPTVRAAARVNASIGITVYGAGQGH